MLKSIRVKVDRYSIEIDYSELKARLEKKKDESLIRNYNSYIDGIKDLPSWTCVLRISIFRQER